MGYLIFEICLIFVLLVLNGIFSMSELAVVSARRIRLRQALAKGSRGAGVALELAENPSRFLSTVQIGITLIGILAGAFGGATLAGLLAELIKDAPLLGAYHATISFAVVVAVITYFSIIIGELIPKSLALNAPEKIATLVARPMKALSTLAAPVVWLLTTPTSFILRLLRVHAVVDPPVTDEEIKGLIDAGTKAGVFVETEQDMLESVIHLGEQRITGLMTPRTKIAWLNLADEPEIIKEQLTNSRFSRLPVAHGALDNMLGYTTTKALLGHLIKENEINPSAVLRQPLYVPETLTVLALLERFQESYTHFAVVIDEFGGVEGLVTLNDVLEAIVGELPTSQHKIAEQGIIRRADGTIILDGRLSLLAFRDEFNIREIPADEQNAYHTLAGFALARLNAVPKSGDRFLWDNYEFEIVSMEGNRIAQMSLKAVSLGDEIVGSAEQPESRKNAERGNEKQEPSA